MNFNIPAVSGLVVTALLVSSSPAPGAIFYVSPTGSNSNSGTTALPWRTIAHAVAKMNPGDTTYVHSGVYDEVFIRFGKSGTAAAPITLMNAPGEQPIINFVRPVAKTYPMIYINNIEDSAKTGIRKAISFITIEGFEIRNGHVGVKWIHASDLTIRRNWIHDNKGQGILGTGGHRIVIDRNRINHNGDFEACEAGATTSSGGTTCNQEHGIYANGTYFIVTNNLIYDNLAIGVVLAATKTVTSTRYPVKYPGPEFAGGRNWVISNNTFAYQAYRGAISLWGASEQVKIENNIFYQNCLRVPGLCANTQGVYVGADDRNISINNNLAYATGTGARLFLQVGAGAVQGVNYTASGNIVNTLDPKFVNASATMPGAPNFRLTSGSPAINAGANLFASGVIADIEGRVRPQTGPFEIGAYEYGGAQQPAVNRRPAKPEGLRVR